MKFGHICKYSFNIQNFLLRCIKLRFSFIWVYQSLVLSHFTYSVQKNAYFTPIPKLHRFGFQNYNTPSAQTDVVLAINFFFFFFFKKKGWKLGGHPLGQKGVVWPPHFWPRSHPHGWSGGGRTTPMAKGVVRPPPKRPKKERKIMDFGHLGVAEPPPLGHRNGSTTPRLVVWWWPNHPL